MATKATKSTSRAVAGKASAVLTNRSTGKSSKSVGASALSQVDAGKVTSKETATLASKVLQDGRSGAATKSAAASVLAQSAAKKAAPGTGTATPRKTKK